MGRVQQPAPVPQPEKPAVRDMVKDITPTTPVGERSVPRLQFDKPNAFMQPKPAEAQPAVQAQQAAAKELATKVQDKNNYYGSDAAKLRAELAKGSAANLEQVRGLTQSLQNRRKELNTGIYAASNPYKVMTGQAPRESLLKPMFKRGMSYEAMARDTGLSEREVRAYADKHYKGYGDKGLIGNVAGGIGKGVGDMFGAAAGLVTKPINTFTKNNQQELADLNKKAKLGEISPDAALERAEKLADSQVFKRAYRDENGVVRLRSANTLEATGDIVKQGTDTASMLPLAGGATKGVGMVAGAMGKQGAANALGRAAGFINPYNLTSAGTRTAQVLSKAGMSDDAAKMVGSALSTNARQSAVTGTAQTASDVLRGELTPEKALMNYGADFALGAGAEIGLGSVAKAMQGSDAVHINRLHPKQMKYNAAEVMGVIKDDARKRLSKAAFGDLQAARVHNPYRTSDGMDIELTKKGNKKYTSTGVSANNDDFVVKQRLAPHIGKAIEKSNLIDSAADVKNHTIAPDGFDYRTVPVRYKGDTYEAKFNIAKDSRSNRNALYETNIKKELPPSQDLAVQEHRDYSGNSYGSNVAENGENVKIGVDQYVKEQAHEQHQALAGEKPTMRERWQDFKADMREKFVDRFSPIEDKIKNEAERLEMRHALDRVLRADGISEAFIRDNKLDKVIQSFANKKEMAMFDQALIAKHAIELEANGVKTGRDLAKDAQLVSEADKLFAEQFAQVREYSDRVLQQTVDYGLISQETADYLRQKYPDYVPFDRIFSESELDARSGRGRIEGEASLSKQDIVQRIQGSERAIDSPLNAFVMKTQAMVQQGERNMAAKLLASYASDPKNPFLLKELKPGEAANGRPTISYLDAGTKRTFLAAPEVARAAKNMNREQLGIILQAAAVPARVLRMGATGINAGFTMANVVKDYIGATINSKNATSAMNPKTLLSALEAAFHHKGSTYLDMQRAGVLGNSYELGRNASQLNLAEIRSHKNWRSRTVQNIKSPLRTLENTIGRSEDFGRAMQFISNKKAAMRQGMSEADAIKFAADQARWNSTNFMRHGTYGKVINAIVPYSNASVQGQRIMLRRFKESPARYSAKVLLGVTAPTIGALAYSYHSEKGKKVMDNLPDYIKDNNVVIVSPTATYDKTKNRWNGVYLMPVPPQYLPLHRQTHNAVKVAMTESRFEVGKTVGDAIEQVTTVNPTEMHRTAAQYTPQVAKPLVESWANKNLFTGQQVVPDSMKNLTAKEQFDDNTSLTARKVGELTGLSPKQLDNAFRTSTAGGGQNALHSSDWLIAQATGAKAEEIKGRSLMDSIVGRFYGPKGTSKGSYYYESLDKAVRDNKLAGNDLEFFQALTTRKFNEGGRVEGKTDAEAMRNSRVLADTPNVAKAISDAAKWRAKQTGEELDPLYQLPLEHQRYFYHIQGTAKNSAEQRDAKNKAPWLEDLQKARSSFFKRQEFKSENSKRIPYPEASPELEAIQERYHSMPKGPEKWAFLDAHPELVEHWGRIEEYNNKVREAQGYAPQRTRPQASEYVKMQMANKNWRDPAVSKYLQDMNIYNITNSASLAEMQGNELDPKALKAIQSLGKYGLVKNPDGTFALKSVDEQGTGVLNIQPGAYDPGARFGSRGRGARKGGSSTAIASFTGGQAHKVASSVSLTLNDLARNKPAARVPEFTAKSISFKKFLQGGRRPAVQKSRAVRFN